MLLQFNFSNHKSFREEASLDLTATGINEYGDHVFNIGNEKILPVTAIYGANASGKSNVMDAFSYMRYFVLYSFGFDLDDKSEKNPNFIIPPSFAFDQNSRNKESSYEVYFVEQKTTNDKEYITAYNYGFTVNSNGIVEEWLNSKARTARKYNKVFYRNELEQILDLDGIPKRQKENIEVSLGQETLIVSLGAKLKISKLEVIYDWFEKNEIIDFGSSFEILIRENKLPDGFTDEKVVREKIVKYLSTFDTDIIDFKVTEGPKDEKGNGLYSVDAIHKSINSDETFSIPLGHESSGTLKMFSLYQYIVDTLEKGSILFIDELNARLHPVLVNNIIRTFTNKESNPNGAQLVFTTHDAIQLDSNSLRRDEIWFTEKTNGQSYLYSLADFVDDGGNKIRKDENYLKNYLVGKYGAIPNLKQISFILGDKNG